MIYIIMFVVGAVMGSFLCCQVRRMECEENLGSRSVCMKCGRKLKWYDNVPILSWTFLRGKCRECGKTIGSAEILAEVGTAVAFLVITFVFLPPWAYDFGAVANISAMEWGKFIVMILITLDLSFLAIYDGCYGVLPTGFLVLGVFLSVTKIVLEVLTNILAHTFEFNALVLPVLSGVLLGGTYLILYLVSRGKWVGDGDWLLALSIGLTAGTPLNALIILFIANFVASVINLPAKRRTKKIHLGPYLVFGFFVVYMIFNLFWQ